MRTFFASAESFLFLRRLAKWSLSKCFSRKAGERAFFKEIFSIERKEKPSCEITFVYSKSLKELFPQYGLLKKHLREIKLEPWQKDIIDRFPKEFLRGLIHSDGCRFITKTTKKQYLRYGFTNASSDIVNLYCATLEKLNISYSLVRKKIEGMMTVSSYNVLTQSQSCANFLDTFIGPKT